MKFWSVKNGKTYVDITQPPKILETNSKINFERAYLTQNFVVTLSQTFQHSRLFHFVLIFFKWQIEFDRAQKHPKKRTKISNEIVFVTQNFVRISIFAFF